jgi:prevent-host-death family protein
MKRVGSYEAKTHLPRLLEEVAAGETIEITKHGHPVAVLSPVGGAGRSASAAADALRAFRRTHRLKGVRIRDLIEEGRRR